MSKWGNYRASDAERDSVVDRLRKAAAEGRIASEELEQRVHQALKAITYDELYATVKDLPGSGRRPRSTGAFAPARRSVTGWAVSTVRANPILILFVIPVAAVAVAMLLAVTVVFAVLMFVVLMLGGRHHRFGSGPWHQYSRRFGPPNQGTPRRGFGPPRRGPGGHWV